MHIQRTMAAALTHDHLIKTSDNRVCFPVHGVHAVQPHTKHCVLVAGSAIVPPVVAGGKPSQSGFQTAGSIKSILAKTNARRITPRVVETHTAAHSFVMPKATIIDWPITHTVVPVACTCQDWVYRGVNHHYSRLQPPSSRKTRYLKTLNPQCPDPGRKTVPANNLRTDDRCKHMKYVHTNSDALARAVAAARFA